MFFRKKLIEEMEGYIAELEGRLVITNTLWAQDKEELAAYRARASKQWKSMQTQEADLGELKYREYKETKGHQQSSLWDFPKEPESHDPALD